MTHPNPDGGYSPPADPPKPSKGRGAPGVDVLDVVEYVHHDPILGGQRRELGVVVGVDDQGLDVVPLTGYRVRVRSDDVTRLSVDDL